jgi:hypothetical protein
MRTNEYPGQRPHLPPPVTLPAGTDKMAKARYMAVINRKIRAAESRELEARQLRQEATELFTEMWSRFAVADDQEDSTNG